MLDVDADKVNPAKRSVQMPNLCSPSTLLVSILLGALLSLMLTLGDRHWYREFLIQFGLTLLFVQFVILASLAILCAFRRWKWQFSPVGTIAICMILAGLFTILASILSAPNLPTGEYFELTRWVLRNTLIALLLSFVVARYLTLQDSWKHRTQLESSARIQALQARIHPHFLFNTLNTITELVHSRPDLAEEALLDLSDLLRTGLRSEARHTLEEEFELVRGYLRIEGLRLGERLDVEWSIDEAVDRATEIPALLIQPLVENAVLHGIASLPDGGRLTIRLEPARFGRARVIVENPMPPPDQPRRQGNRTALENIRQRLALAYEEGASLKTEKTDAMFRAVLTLPLNTAN